MYKIYITETVAQKIDGMFLRLIKEPSRYSDMKHNWNYTRDINLAFKFPSEETLKKVTKFLYNDFTQIKIMKYSRLIN